MQLQVPIAGGAALHRRGAVAMVRRNLSDKNVAFIAIVAVFVLLTAIALLGVICAKRRRRRQRQGEQAGNHEHGVVDNMLSVWQHDGSRYERAWGGDTTDSRRSPRRPSQPSPRVNGGERRRASEANNTSRTINGAGAGLSSHGSRNTVASEAVAEPDVDRSTSIRSVMTLPPYSCIASHNEQVMGREGERDGIDVVIALPTDDDDEALREEEMDALYQIRLARRRQIAERDELRRQQNEARRRDDGEALAEIRAQSRTAPNIGELDELRREVSRIQETRQRSLSRVSYADLGVARPDGTRIRANSNESERVGLLSDAASIALSSQSCAPSLALHRRGRSASSLVSVDSDHHNLARSRGGSQSEVPSSRGGDPRARPNPELVEADLGDVEMPPPDYHSASPDDGAELTQSTTALDEPPPDYPGLVRPATESERGAWLAAPGDPEAAGAGSGKTQTGRRVGGIPQLPSLRISGLPAIVIEPSSAQPVSR
ncbi:hypothetical protein OCS_06416 [Ophiocordyceps sinensis CO18]|uniref:Uncharacterized protein n=1 Tax=Ophiocordyceps sinensis (strain Co18 / CGMCC 3.14243) TaxID=911162 RepID=T5A7Z8_OPHSC|nr:hypothetical protein OCS_06416 [Ophiocordyceps sinensis CO18]